MNVTISQETFFKALALVAPLARKSTMPILEHILLDAADGILNVAATNLDVSLKVRVPAQVKTAGAISLPARSLTDFVNSLPPDTVSIELNPKTQTARFQCARYTANIKGIDAMEFPLFQNHALDSYELVVDPDVLRDGLGKTIFCTSPDDSRPALSGICLRAAANTKRAYLYAADGFRMSKAEIAMTEKVPARTEIILPANGMRLAARLLADAEAPVNVFVKQDSTSATLVFENAVLFLNALEGKFPDADAILPKGKAFRFVVNRAELASASKLARIFAREDSQRVMFDFPNDATSATVLVSARSEMGDDVASVDVMLDGQATHPLVLNSRFVDEALAAVSTPQVEFSDNGVETPVVFRAVGDDSFTHVIMPMTLK